MKRYWKYEFDKTVYVEFTFPTQDLDAAQFFKVLEHLGMSMYWLHHLSSCPHAVWLIFETIVRSLLGWCALEIVPCISWIAYARSVEYHMSFMAMILFTPRSTLGNRKLIRTSCTFLTLKSLLSMSIMMAMSESMFPWNNRNVLRMVLNPSHSRHNGYTPNPNYDLNPRSPSSHDSLAHFFFCFLKG